MFIDIRNIQERRQARDSQFEGTRDIRNGYLFEVNGSVEGDRDGMVWFKALDGNSEPFQIFYNGVIGDLRANMFVKIERNPKDPARWQIIEFDTGIYFDDQSAYEQLPSLSQIPAKQDYEWPPGFPGAKALNIFPRAVTDFAVRPTSPASMKARVYSGIYPGATNYARFQGPVNTKDFTADVPGAGLARLAAISIDNTGTLNYTNGTTFVDGLPMPDASLPAVPASQMLISAIRLANGMTAIEESNFDLEMRPLMANGTVNVKVSEVWDSDFDTPALQAAADGNIGIGTATPDFSLEIEGTNARIHLDGDNAQMFVDRSAANNRGEIAFQTAAVGKWFVGLADSDTAGVDGTEFFIGTSSAAVTPALLIETGGSIGIGTAAPLVKLEVGDANPTFGAVEPANSVSILAGGDQFGRLYIEGSTQADILFDDSGGAANEKLFQLVNVGGVFKFRVLNDVGTTIKIDNIIAVDNTNGNVGIGTASPGSLMEWDFSTENLEFVDAGSAAATEQNWIEVQVAGGTGYIRVFASK